MALITKVEQFVLIKELVNTKDPGSERPVLLESEGLPGTFDFFFNFAKQSQGSR